jgi:uncharacterized protein YndB with AHSA1/START domain
VSTNQVVIEASPATVFDILVDPEAYPAWVVGTKAMRGWTPEWPELGARFFHRVGFGAMVLDDSSEVLAIEPNQRLTLEVRIRPLGIGVVDVTLEPVGPDRATLVTLVETTTGGFFDRIPVPVLQPLLLARNELSLRRLARLARGRAQTPLQDLHA